MTSNDSALRYMMPVYDMRKDELENAVIELRAERIDLLARLNVDSKSVHPKGAHK